MSLQSQNAACGHMETDDAPCRCGNQFIGGAAENYRKAQMQAQEEAAFKKLKAAIETPCHCRVRQGGQVADVISTNLTVDEAMWAKWNAGRQKYGEEFVGDPIQELYAEYIDALNYFNEIERRGLMTADLVYARLSTRRLAELVRTEARR